jgi:catalase
LQGKASLLWEEAQVIAGKNADFHRQDLWNNIENGNYPEYVVCFDTPCPSHLADLDVQ